MINKILNNNKITKFLISFLFIFVICSIFLYSCDSPGSNNPPQHIHSWVDATCTAPKTCSLCGATDGEALGHNAIEVFGQAPTCTEPGQTNLVYCDVCDQNLSEAQEIAPLGHTEETVPGTPATCTDPGKTDGKKCSACGVITVEQTAIDALGHKAGEDDGDVTTAVTCERCDHVFVEAKEAITLTIPTFENGAVVDLEALKAARLVRKELDGLKILGSGELTKALTVKATVFSATAKEKIEAAGGKTEEV
mgnify:CR=1 FL=1